MPTSTLSTQSRVLFFIPKIQTEKEDKSMSEKAKATHKAFCDYEIDKAKSLRVKTVRKTTEQKPSGIRTSGLSKIILARQLASLF